MRGVIVMGFSFLETGLIDVLVLVGDKRLKPLGNN